MASKEFLIESRNAYMRRAQHAEKQHRIAHSNAEILMKFIKLNCAILEVPESWSQNVNVLQIDDKFYMIEPERKETLQ